MYVRMLYNRYKLPASIIKLFALWKSTWCVLCTKKKLLNALLEKWRHFETLRTSLLTFLSEANAYCNPPFEQLGIMNSLMDIDAEMRNFKVSTCMHTNVCMYICVVFILIFMGLYFRELSKDGKITVSISWLMNLK